MDRFLKRKSRMGAYNYQSFSNKKKSRKQYVITSGIEGVAEGMERRNLVLVRLRLDISKELVPSGLLRYCSQ
jgi:hypothetical protein